jgi:ATP phosphoribosyltransferase
MLKIAIQKNGRLTGDTIRLLGETGIYFQHGEKVLRTLARGMNLEIFFSGMMIFPGMYIME